METWSQMDHIRMNPQMYCPGYENNITLLGMALRFLSHFAGVEESTRVDIVLEKNRVRIRTFGRAIPFEVMQRLHRAFHAGMGYTIRVHGEEIPMILMALCQDAALTSFCDGKKLTANTALEARCTEEACTNEADGAEMCLTHEKEFELISVIEKLRQFHALNPETKIRINGNLL